MNKNSLGLLCCMVLAACGTTSVGLNYAPPSALSKASASARPVLVATFTDARGEPATWLGAIRGGFGNPLKNLESDKPVSELVAAAFSDGLRARGISVTSGAAQTRLSGTVKKLDCNQYVRREGNAEVELRVQGPGGETRLAKTFSASRVDGSAVTLAAGVFASVEDLRVTLEATLREVVDKALEDAELRAALQI